MIYSDICDVMFWTLHDFWRNENESKIVLWMFINISNHKD